MSQSPDSVLVDYALPDSWLDIMMQKRVSQGDHGGFYRAIFDDYIEIQPPSETVSP